MTSHNLNKIVRSNIKSSWLLSKNTTEIVNSCISKIYKNSQNNFKYELMPSKMATVRAENKGPVRSLRSQERVRQPTITATVAPTRRNRVPAQTTAVGGDRLLSAVMHNHHPAKRGAVANVALNKKLLKTPTYRIYGQRRFGSSASSSQGSYIRRHEDRRRQRNSSEASQMNYLMRSLGTQPGANVNFGLNAAVAKYLIPVRNQHIESRLGSVPQAVKVSSAIQRDLMPIDQVRNAIGVGRRRGLATVSHSKQEADPMEGWHHPPPHDLLSTRLTERCLADSELLEQYRRLKSITENRHAENLQKMEKTKQLLGPAGTRNVTRQRLSNTYSSTAREVSRIDQATYNQRIESELARRRAIRKTLIGSNTVPTAASLVLGASAPPAQTIEPIAQRLSTGLPKIQKSKPESALVAPKPEPAQLQQAQPQRIRPQLAHKQQPTTAQKEAKPMKPKLSSVSVSSKKSSQKKSPGSKASVKSATSSTGRGKATRALDTKVSSKSTRAVDTKVSPKQPRTFDPKVASKPTRASETKVSPKQTRTFDPKVTTSKPTRASDTKVSGKQTRALETKTKHTRTSETKVHSSGVLKSGSSQKAVNAPSRAQQSKLATKAPAPTKAEAPVGTKGHEDEASKNLGGYSFIKETAAALMAGTGNGISLNSSRFSRAAFFPKRF